MPERRNDPIIEIPNDMNPRSSDPVKVKLVFDSPLKKQKEQGTLYIYKVKAVENCETRDGEVIEPGKEAILFAWDGLHRTIQEAEGGPPKKNDVLEIVRANSGKRSNWFVDIEAVGNNPRPETQEDYDSTHSANRSSNPQPRRNDPDLDAPVDVVPGFRDHVAEYAACTNAARAILFTQGDGKVEQSALQAMAFSIYRSAKDQGIEIPGDYDHEENMENRVPFEEGSDEEVSDPKPDVPEFEPNPRKADGTAKDDGKTLTSDGIGAKGVNALLPYFKTAGVKKGHELAFAKRILQDPELPSLKDMTPDESKSYIIPALKDMKAAAKQLKDAGFEGTIESYQPAIDRINSDAKSQKEATDAVDTDEELSEEELDRLFGTEG